MENPIKIIHKYKNSNNRIQYHIHIFIGDILDKKQMAVLQKIKNMNFYSALTDITEQEIEILVGKYGEFWYEKFFNSYHIAFTKETTNKNAVKMKELKERYGIEWIKAHFDNYQKHLETVTYSYETKIRDLIERKNVERTIKKKITTDIDENVDYTTTRGKETASGQMIGGDFPELDLDEIMSNEYNIIGGSVLQGGASKQQDSDSEYEGTCNDSSSSTDDDLSERSDNEFNISESDENDLVEIRSDDELVGGQNEDRPFDPTSNESSDQDLEDLDDTDDIESIFSELDDVDKNVNITTRDIKTILSEKTYDNIYNKIATFDKSNDTNMFDANLKNIYEKNYITHQYIYPDDTIKKIHGKICCGFKNNDIYGKNPYIIPSYQYFWSEYLINGVVNKVMVGQKWVIKNDIAHIDIEPNPNLGIYEDLRGNLKKMRDNMKRQGKIKRDDDDQNTLTEYDGYYTCNEIFMTDIYNDLGLDYNPNFEEISNLFDVYIKVYYPKIQIEDFNNILILLKRKSLESEKIVEMNKTKKIFETINNDLILENEIMRDVEITKATDYTKYIKFFKESNVMHSVLRTYVSEKYAKLDLFRIFDNFNLSEEYPFVQYQPINGMTQTRYNKEELAKNENKDMIMKWFENAPYGISFKIKIRHMNAKTNNVFDEYVSVGLNDTGRIDYHIQWKEEYNRTMEDVLVSYEYVRKIVKKINDENFRKKNALLIPSNNDFRFAFISTIQRFELPGKYVIDHNDLSSFARNFFPYITLVIEPRKRASKQTKPGAEELSKYGTYLRYKRISKYENKSKVEHRIIFFMRNYEYNDQLLASEISKEFNITEKQAFQEIEMVRVKHPYIKKSRKVLKKLENIPKYKSPGITVDIQGKTRDRYKLRIAGARDTDQLIRITQFMNILIYLYVDTYLNKNPARQQMKDRLMKLTNIAKRRNKVEQIYKETSAPQQFIKQMIKVDIKRLKSDLHDTKQQWSKECQNSGLDTRRRPQQYLDPDELTLKGYVWYDTLNGTPFGHYARTVKVDDNGNIAKRGKEVTLRAMKLPLDDSGENFVYYACNPEDNGKHMYIGILGKSNNAAPCCFIKDHLLSKNPKKKKLYLKIMGLLEDEPTVNVTDNEQIYILQDNIAVEEGRFAFLPKYLDILLNNMLNKDLEMHGHNMIKTLTGYYFKYGVKSSIGHNQSKYLSALESALDMTIDDILHKLVYAIEHDKHNLLFTSLNNGDIRNNFRTAASYVEYLKNVEFIDYLLINDLVCTPGVIRKNGICVVFFNRKIRVYQKNFEKERIKVDYYVTCSNSENVFDLKDPTRESILMIKEKKNFYPIVMVTKNNVTTIELDIKKTYSYADEPNNIINHIFDYYRLNCYSEYSVLVRDHSQESFIAKNMVKMLSHSPDKKYHPKSQIIDTRYKCKYLVTNGGYIIPTTFSGSIYNLPIIVSLDSYIQTYQHTVDYLSKIMEFTQGSVKLIPIGLYYTDKKNKNYIVTSLITENNFVIPITKEEITQDYITEHNLIIKHKSDEDLIDNEIVKGNDNYVIDDRIYNVAKSNYDIEMYQLFRLHLSYYLNNTENGQKYHKALVNIIHNPKIQKNDKKIEIKKILYKICDNELLTKYKNLITTLQGGASSNDKKWIHVMPDDKKIDYASVKFFNNREICNDYDNKNTCGSLPYCNWNVNKNICTFNIKKKNLLEYINKVGDEIIQNDLKAHEILHINDHTVADIINYNVIRERAGEEIIVGTNKNTEKLLAEIFGKDKLPKFTKQADIDITQNYIQLNRENPLNDYPESLGTNKHVYIQNIIENNNTVFRIFANGYFWLMHPYDNNEYRNLGYYSLLQTELSNIYKSQVIDWLLSDSNTDNLKNIIPYIPHKKLSNFITKLSMSITSFTNYVVELYILSKLYDIMIYVYNASEMEITENNTYMYIFHPYDGIVYDMSKNTSDSVDKLVKKYDNFKKNIYMKFYYASKNIYPSKTEIIYQK